MNAVDIYQTADHRIEVEVRFEEGSVWLTQEQIALLFGTQRPAITKHLKNIFTAGELHEDVVSSILEHTTQHGAIPGKTQQRQVKYYNLDAIISIGYRVNSKQATNFRIWATQRLKDYLIEGVAINEKRLAQKKREIQVLHDGIRILSRAIEDMAADDENGWMRRFSLGLQLLDDYDHEALDQTGRHSSATSYPAMEEYRRVVDQMRQDFSSDVFGKEKDGGFESAVNQIRQTFGNQDLYPSMEEKAAMLLYLVVKNHAFADGNKRIAAACFLLFLERNRILFDAQDVPLISNEALAALTLFVASSKSEEMNTVKSLIISILNRNQL